MKTKSIEEKLGRALIEREITRKRDKNSLIRICENLIGKETAKISCQGCPHIGQEDCPFVKAVVEREEYAIEKLVEELKEYMINE